MLSAPTKVQYMHNVLALWYFVRFTDR